MSRLLQFFDGQAKRAVAGFEGVPGGLSKALKMLEQRFGQPHVVAKGCVDALVEGANRISQAVIDKACVNLLIVQEPCTRLCNP